MCNEPFSKGGLRSLGFRVWVLVSGFSRRVWVFRFWVQVSGCGFRVWGFGFRELGARVLGCAFRVWDRF